LEKTHLFIICCGQENLYPLSKLIENSVFLKISLETFVTSDLEKILITHWYR